MFDVTPAVISDRAAGRWSDVPAFAPAARLTAVATHPALDAAVTIRRSTAWSDLPTGAGRLSEVRRRLRELQVQRAVQGRGLAA